MPLANPESECQLFGDFGIFIQFVLGFLCFSTLLLKEVCAKAEKKRQKVVFFLDISK
jgi:hypothetical protein